MTADMTQETDDVVMPESEDSGSTEKESEPSDTSAGEDALSALTAERDQLKDMLLRKQAEFENFRKRTERERSEFVQFALADCIREILNVLDSFELALRDMGSEEEKSLAIHRGYELIYKQLLESLQRFGLEEIAAEGTEFDPHVHEGVGTQPRSDVPEGTVVQELRKGYLLKGKLLRPTMVTVAAAAGAEGDPQES